MLCRKYALLVALIGFCDVEVSRAAPAEDAPPKSTAAVEVAGTWLGELDAKLIKLRIGFVIQLRMDGQLKGKLVDIDQGGAEVPLDAVEFKDGDVILHAKKIHGRFDGKWNKDRTELAGQWKQFAQTFPLTLKKVTVLPGIKRPQEPQKPYPYREEEVSFTNTKHNVALKGTLTLPMGQGPFPSVVLVSGSGPQNRDEELMGHRPFLILADALTRRGIAVLRFDDRDFGKPDLTFKATSADLTEDVLAGVQFLQTRPECASGKIGLVGHSEGGLIAPMLAAREKGIAFVVMLAGPGISGDKILQLQGELLKKHAGIDEATLKQEAVDARKIYQIIKDEPNDEAAMQKLNALFDALIAAEGKIQGAKEKKAAYEVQFKTLLTPWFRYFLGYDPRPALTKVTCPVLAVIGEKDFQVPPKENLPVIEAALKEGGNRDFAVKELPGLNHLLQPCTTGMLDEYGRIETTMSPDALKLIGDWILEHTK